MHFLFLAALLSLPAQAKTLLVGDSHSVGEFGATLENELPALKRYAVSGSRAGDWLKPKMCPRKEDCPYFRGYVSPKGYFPGEVPKTFLGLPRLLKQEKPDLVVVALGTNDANLHCRRATELGIAEITKLAGLIPAKKCKWVGPPVYTRGPLEKSCGADYQKFVNQLKAAVVASGCEFIDSREILDPKTGLAIEADSGDEVHFSAETARIWARSVAKHF